MWGICFIRMTVFGCIILISSSGIFIRVLPSVCAHLRLNYIYVAIHAGCFELVLRNSLSLAQRYLMTHSDGRTNPKMELSC